MGDKGTGGKKGRGGGNRGRGIRAGGKGKVRGEIKRTEGGG